MNRLALLSTFALVGGITNASELHLPFEYTIYPCFYGEGGRIDIRVDTEQFPAFYYFSAHRESGRLVYDTVRYFIGGGQVATIPLTIPSSLVDRGGGDIEFGIQDSDPSVASLARFSVRIAKEIKTAERYYNKRVVEDVSFTPERHITVYDANNPSSEQEIGETYRFEGFTSQVDADSRRFGFSLLTLTYSSAILRSGGVLGGNAELRLLDHIDEFPELGETVGDRYRKIPLKMELRSSGNDSVRYGFVLKWPHYFSKKDYTVASTSRNSFRSSDLFVPLRQGHDTDTYRYQIVLSDLSASKDSFILEGETSFARRFFGNNPNTEYVVRIGGQNDA